MASRSEGVVSKNDSTCRLGTMRLWPGETGRASRIHTASAFSPWIRSAGIVQKAHGAARGTSSKAQGPQ